MPTAIIRCIGRVQGVFYRASTRDEAVRLGLKGWVKNERNGDVLIHAQGEMDKINQLIAWCKQGPPLAKVDDVKVEWVEGDPQYDSFNVTY